MSEMFDINAFKAALAKKGYTQAKLAKEIGISSRTLSNRLKSGDFGSVEIKRISEVLDISDPIPIFFGN